MEDQTLNPSETPAEVPKDLAPGNDAVGDVAAPEDTAALNTTTMEVPADPVPVAPEAPIAAPAPAPDAPPAAPVTPVEAPAASDVAPAQEAQVPAPAAPEVPVQASPEAPAPATDLDAIITDIAIDWNDEQLAAILAAGLEPAQARQEIGLAHIHKEPSISLNEAIRRAKPKYGLS